MNIDDLKQNWREEMNADINTDSLSYETLVHDVSEIDRQARFGRNVIVCLTLAIIVLFGFVLFVAKPDLGLFERTGMIAMAGLFCYFSYAQIQSVMSSEVENWTLARRLEIEIEKIQKQVSLTRSMPLRLLLPMFLLVILISFSGYYERTGSLVPNSQLILYFAGCVVLFGGTAWGYLRSERKKLTPLLNKLRELQHQLMAD
jgi:hypothetical protein